MNNDNSENQNLGAKWLSMSEASRLTPYSAEYLSLLARRGKLASKKVDNTWYTTKAILDEYMRKQMLRAQVLKGEAIPNVSADTNPAAVTETATNPKIENAPVPLKAEKLTPIETTLSLAHLRSFHDDIREFMKREGLPLPKEGDNHIEKIMKEFKDPRELAYADRQLAPEYLPQVKKPDNSILDALDASHNKSTKDVESALERVLDKKMGKWPKYLKAPVLPLPRQSMRTISASKVLIVTTILTVLILTVSPVPYVFSAFESTLNAAKSLVSDANTVMGMRPGTHANELLILDPGGNIAITGHIETGSELISRVADGTAPIVVDSKTEVKNLNAEYLDGASSTDFTLEYVTKNGSLTKENVSLLGSVEIGKTLLVRGATKLLGGLSVAGDVSVLGAADFSGLLTAKSDADIKGNLSVGKNISLHGSLEAGGAIIAGSGSLGSLSVQGPLTSTGDMTLGNASALYILKSKSTNIDKDGNAAFAGSLTASSLALTGTATSTMAGPIAFTGSSAFASLTVSGPTSLQDLTFRNATGTSLFSTNLTTTNATSTNLLTSGQTILASASGNVGIGTTTPLSKLDVVNAESSTAVGLKLSTGQVAFPTTIFSGTGEYLGIQGSSARAGIGLVSYATRPEFIGALARGTAVSPTAVTNNNILASYEAAGFDGSNWTSGIANRIAFTATENWGTNAHGTGIDFQVTGNGATAGSNTRSAMFLDSTGSALFPNSIYIGQGASAGATTNALLNIQASNGTPAIGFNSVDGGGWSIVPTAFSVDSSRIDLRFNENLTTNWVTFQSGGNVGIGTTDPSAAKLVVSTGVTNVEARLSDRALSFTRASDAAAISSITNDPTNQNMTITTRSNLFLGTNGQTSISIIDGLGSPGTVGIGLTNPSTLVKLESTGIIYADSQGANQFAMNSTGADFGFIQNTASQIWSLGHGPTVNVLGTPVLTWSAAGNVGIGTTANQNHDGVTARLEVAATTATARLSALDYYAADANGPILDLAKSRGASVGTITYPQTDDSLGSIFFSGASQNSARFNDGARVQGFVGSTWTSANQDSYLTFSTTQSGVIGTSERIRITGAGNVGIGVTNPQQRLDVNGLEVIRGVGTLANNAGAAELQVGYGLASAGTAGAVSRLAIQPYGHTGGPFLFIARDTTSVANLDIDYGATHGMTLNSSGNVGIGLTNPTHLLQLSSDDAAKPTSNTWTIVSDKRLKKNIQDFNDGLAIINQINPVSYELNGLADTPDGAKGIGILAQDVKDIIPYTINTFYAKLHPEDATSTELYDFNSSALTFVLINGVKELDAKVDLNASTTASLLAGLSSRIDSIELRVTALENASSTMRSGLTLDATTTDIITHSVLATLGASIMDGLTHFGDIVVSALTIGSKEKPTGVTFFDSVTGDPYCMKVSNGVQVTVLGVCGASVTSALVTATNPVAPAPNTSDASTTISSIPVVSDTEVTSTTPVIDMFASSTPTTDTTASSTPDAVATNNI